MSSCIARLAFQPVTQGGNLLHHFLSDFRFHDVRHTSATRLLRDSGNLKLVQKLLRHEDVATTVKYAHADDEDLRRAMESVEKSRKNPRKIERSA